METIPDGTYTVLAFVRCEGVNVFRRLPLIVEGGEALLVTHFDLFENGREFEARKWLPVALEDLREARDGEEADYWLSKAGIEVGAVEESGEDGRN